jgi:drug/metabolite transporter (DMT)-like permease
MMMMAVGILFIRRLTDSMPSYDITILTTIAGTVLMAPTLLIEAAQGSMQISTSAAMWLLLAVAGIVGQGLTAFWWNQAISIVGASVSAMFMYIPPFVAIVVAHFLLGDPIRGSQLFGGVLILLGVALSSSKISLRKKGVHTANP